MNNATTNITTATIDAIVQEYYGNYFYSLGLWSSTGLMFYATLLKFGQEVEFIWCRSFSWPALLYIFTRYGQLVSISFRLWFYYVTPWAKNCTLIDTLGGVFAIFGLIGIQGLLTARAYSLTGGNKILSKVFIFLLVSATTLNLTQNIMFDACSANVGGTYSLLVLLINTTIIVSDLIVFAVCMWKIWGVWKLGRQARIQGSNGLASILLKQGILRCCFVVFVTVVDAILSYRSLTNFLSDTLSFYENALSSIMVADFTLELRRQNSANIEANNISLSTITFSNVLENIEQSILVEMSTPNQENEGQNAGDDSADGIHENIPAAVSDIQTA